MPDVTIPRPPKVPKLGEPPPIVEPMLVDLPPWEGLEVEGLEPLDVDVSEVISAEFAAQVQRIALDDDRVQQLLAGKRHVVVGVRAIDEKGHRPASFVVVGYSYDDGSAYEVRVDRAKDELEVIEVSLADYHPAPADEEIEQAIQLARADDRVSAAIRNEFDAHALLVSDVEGGDEHRGTRRFSVVFGPPEERLPRVHVIVDLASGEVVQVKMGAI